MKEGNELRWRFKFGKFEMKHIQIEIGKKTKLRRETKVIKSGITH
jgi:hypothetical protein